MQDVTEVLENHIWIGVAWRDAFVVPFIPWTVPSWSDACFEPVEWSNNCQPRQDGDQGWQIVRSPATDADGWVYGTAFDHLREERPGGRASKRTNDRVRSRLWRRLDAGEADHQQAREAPAATSDLKGSSSGSGSGRASSHTKRGLETSTTDAGRDKAVSAGKAAWLGAVHAVQTTMPGVVKRASFAGMVNTFLKLVRDAAARHNSAMITPDITGWFFVISTHSEELKRQQLSQLQHMMWFTQQEQLKGAMRPGRLGKNPPGVVLRGAAAAALAAQDPSRQQGVGQIDAAGASVTAVTQNQASEAASERANSSSTTRSEHTASQHTLSGQPFKGLRMHIGSSKPSKCPEQQSGLRTAHDSSSSGHKGCPPPAGAAAGLQLHVAELAMLDELLAGAQYSQAAYGYVAAAGHLSNLGNAIKMLATLPHFNAITGASLEANIRAMHTLAGFCPQDVLLAAWHNDTFRPCHYVAIDVKRGNIVLGIRGSLELGDLETDVTAAPLPFEFQGVSGWVHEGLLAAAAYVLSNTVDALAEAAQRCPGWPLVVAGHSLGGGVAALVTLLLQQPGAAPRGMAGVRCITIGPPAVLSQELCGLCEEYVTSIVLGADAIPRLSTFSVESLLLDLVNGSISRRVTNQLAATTSSVAASTAEAISNLAAGLSRLANTATNNMVSNVNSMKSSLASFKGLPLIEGTLGEIPTLLGLPGPITAASAADIHGPSAPGGGSAVDLNCTGTGSVELTHRHHPQPRQGQPQMQGRGDRVAEAVDVGLKQVAIMLQHEHEDQLRRASLEQQQQQHQVQHGSSKEGAGASVSGVCDGKDVSEGVALPGGTVGGGCGGDSHGSAAGGGAGDGAAARSGLESARLPVFTPGLAASLASPAEQPRLLSSCQPPSCGNQQQQQVQTQSHLQVAPQAAAPFASSSCASPQISKVCSRRQDGTLTGSSSSSRPGGAKLVSGGTAAGNIMIFPRHDDANIIMGIQEAWAGLRPPGAALATNSSATRSGSDCTTGRSNAAGTHEHSTPQPKQQRSQDGTGHSMPAFQIEQHLPESSAAGAAAAPQAKGVNCQSTSKMQPGLEAKPSGVTDEGTSQLHEDGRSSSAGLTSAPGLHQWASDGLSSLGEPSWLRLSRSGDGAVDDQGLSQQQQQQHGSGEAAGSADDSTVHALEADLKRTARLYPPGRILWILSDELVGPAAQQLMAAVAGHLQPAAAAAAADASGKRDNHVQAPQQEQMDMPASVLTPSTKPVLRTNPGQCQKQQQPQAAPLPKRPSASPLHQHQASPVSSKTAAQDAATAHAVAAASAKHILQDVHSLEARMAAVAALQAAQHEHPPLQLHQEQSPAEAAAQLEQQLRLQQQDLQSAEAAVSAASPPLAGAAREETFLQAPSDRQQDGSSTHAQGSHAGKDKQQQPLRTLRPPAQAAVQLVAADEVRRQDSRARRASSGSLEVEGSAAVRAAGYGWPLSWGSSGTADSELLPQELRELLHILGTPCDAASALAIGYKKQVLLQHFWQQRQQDASAEAAALARSRGAAGGSSMVRSNSESHLLKFEDVVRAATSSTRDTGAGGSAVTLPQLELVDHSWWGTLSSLGGVMSSYNLSTTAGGTGSDPHDSCSKDTANDVRSTTAPPAAAPPPPPEAAAALREMRSYQLGSVDSSDNDSTSGSESAGAHTAEHQQRHTEGAEQLQQQHVELAALQQAEEYVLWTKQQDARQQQHKQQQHQHQHQQQKHQQKHPQQHACMQRPSCPSAGSEGTEEAAGSVVQLVRLPATSAADSQGSFKASCTPAAAAAAGDHDDPRGPSMSAICAPLLNPAADDAPIEAAPGAGYAASGVRMPPVVVMPDRDVFSKLLLHKTAVLDHLPSSYVKTLTELKEAYSSLPQLLQKQQQAAQL